MANRDMNRDDTNREMNDRATNSRAATARAVKLLVVTDGSDDSARAASLAGDLFPTADVEIVSAVVVARSVYEGTTGFAGPVVGDDELTEIERARRVDAMGATASTARALGGRPVRQIEERGQPLEVVLDVVERDRPDVVVIAANGRGAPDTAPAGAGHLVDDLVERLDRPVVVVPGASTTVGTSRTETSTEHR